MEKRLSKCFADNFSDLLEECKLDYRTLAKDENLGINKSSISAYANNTSTPTLENCIKIADYFGVSLDWLVGRSRYRSDNNRHQTVSGIGLTEAAALKLSDILSRDEDGRKWINLLLSSGYIEKIAEIVKNHYIAVVAGHTFNDNLRDSYDKILSSDVFGMMARLALGTDAIDFLSVKEENYLYEMFAYMCKGLRSSSSEDNNDFGLTEIMDSLGGKSGLREMYSAQGTKIMHDLLSWSAMFAESKYLDQKFRCVVKEYKKAGLV